MSSIAEAMAVKPKRIPRDARKFKIIGAEFQLSKDNKLPMYVLELESTDNPVENLNGEPLDVNGLKNRKWVVLQSKDGTVHRETARRVGLLLKAAGISDLNTISVSDLIAQPNPGMFIGKTIRCVCETKLAQQVKEDGVTPIVGSDGQPIVSEQFEIGDIV